MADPEIENNLETLSLAGSGPSGQFGFSGNEEADREEALFAPSRFLRALYAPRWAGS